MPQFHFYYGDDNRWDKRGDAKRGVHECNNVSQSAGRIRKAAARSHRMAICSISGFYGDAVDFAEELS
jgi:hypothetical protein